MNWTSLKNMKALALAAFAFLVSNTMDAMPASPFPLTVCNSDGSTVEVRLHGDETFHVITSADNKWLLERNGQGDYFKTAPFDSLGFVSRYRLAKAKAAVLAQPAKLGGSGFPAHGQQRAIAILVEYPETEQHPEGRRFRIENPRQHFDDMLNAPDYNNDGATGSVHNYFFDSSNGQLDLRFDVYGPITLENDLSFYTKLINGENLNAWCMAEEACRAVDDVVDFATYDRDNDGIIDNVYIFYAGEGGATSANPADCVWQHAADIEKITGKQFKFDNLRLNHYACSNEYRYVTGASSETVIQAEGIGTVCHEFSHVLGLPDFYDVTGGGTTTPGQWAIMDTGCHLNDSRTPPLYSAIERLLLGWIEPVLIGKEPKSLSLRNIAENEAYRINTPNDNEYFLLENRRQKGWDSFLPGHGMLVWHINYNPDYWNSNQVNTRPIAPGVDIVRADGIFGLATQTGDPFPGSENVTALNDEGYPNMRTQDYKPTGAPISNITEVGEMISFDICKSVSSLGKVDGLKADNITPTAFLASWNITHPLAGYVLNVYSRDNDGITYTGVYHDLNVSSNEVQVKGLTPGTRYFFTVKAVVGNVSGEVSDEYSLVTPEMTFEFMSPSGVEVSEVTDNSFNVVWNPLDRAVDYAVTVSTEQPGETRSVEVDFTDGIENLPAGWTTNSNFTMSMNGYYGSAAPSLSMTDDYGRIQSPVLPSSLCGLAFWYRERSGDGNAYIDIELFVNGEWRSVDKVALSGSMSNGEVYSLSAGKIPDGVSAVKIVYHKSGKGSLAIDDIKVEYAGTITLIPLDGWNDHRLGSDVTEADVTDLDAGKEYYFSVCGIDDKGLRSSFSEPLKIVTANNAAVSVADDCRLKIVVDGNGNVSVPDFEGTVEIFDINGRNVGMHLPVRGIYILKTDVYTEKIVY